MSERRPVDVGLGVQGEPFLHRRALVCIEPHPDAVFHQSSRPYRYFRLVHEGGGRALIVFRWDRASTVMQGSVAHYSHNI